MPTASLAVSQTGVLPTAPGPLNTQFPLPQHRFPWPIPSHPSDLLGYSQESPSTQARIKSQQREPAGTEDRLGQDSKGPQAVTHPCGPPNNLQGVTVTVPVLQTRKLRHRDIKQLTKLRCQDSGPKSGASSPEHASLLLGASCAHPSALRSLLSVSLPSRPAPPDTVVTS